jgi:predicted  nucleic acid-binding Zn-ribbon protein
MEDLIAQLESEMVELKAKIAQKDEVLGADSDDRANLLQQQLATAEAALATSTAEAGSLRTERDRLAVDKNALDTLATQIIADIAAMPGLQNTPHPTLETAVEYLRERCRFFQADAREERRALDKYVGLVTPAHDALERRIDELNNQWLSAEADVVQCREHAQELQDQLDDQVNQIIRLQTDLKTCALPLALIYCQCLDRKYGRVVTDNLIGLDDKKNVPATARNLAEIHAKERAEFASTRAELEGIKEELDGTETHLRITEKALADCKLLTFHLSAKFHSFSDH